MFPLASDDPVVMYRVAELPRHICRRDEHLHSDSSDLPVAERDELSTCGPASGVVAVHLQLPSPATRHRAGRPPGHLRQHGCEATTVTGRTRRRGERRAPCRSGLQTEVATCTGTHTVSISLVPGAGVRAAPCLRAFVLACRCAAPGVVCTRVPFVVPCGFWGGGRAGSLCVWSRAPPPPFFIPCLLEVRAFS